MRVFTGDEVGLVKDTRLIASADGAPTSSTTTFNSVNRAKGIQKLSRAGPSTLATACKDGQVRMISSETGEVAQTIDCFTTSLNEDGKPIVNKFRKSEHFVGLYHSQKDNTLVTCTDLGRVCYKRAGEAEDFSRELRIDTAAFAEARRDPKFSKKVVTGSKIVNQDLLFSMKVHEEESNLFITGGSERDLALWDVNAEVKDSDVFQPIWTAKNVPHNFLDMREPVWITDLCFLDKKGDHSKIVVGTGKHQLRMYDVRNGSGSKSKSSNDRPCMNVVVREPQSCTNRGANPIRQICSSGDGNIVYFADSVGQVGQFDLRNQKTVNVYKGPAGSVTGLTSFGNRIAAVGLDRFLHVWDATKGAVVQKVYLKQKLSCVLIDEEFVAASVAGEKREAEEEEETRDDNDDIFSRMEKAVR